MKRKILAVVTACFMLAGCTSSPAGSTDKPINDAPVNKGEALTDTLFIGYNRQAFGAWETPDSYMVNAEGKKILEMSNTEKSIIEINGEQYGVERSIGNVTQNEYGWYDNDYIYAVYDSEGVKQGELKDINYAQHIADGDFYVYNYKDREYYIINIFTGERRDVDQVEIMFRNNEVVGLMYLDENYDLKGISDPDGDNYKELLLYENGYIVSTDENSFLACQLKAAPAGEGTNNGSNYARRVTHLLTLEGELVTDIAFDTISTYEDHILAKAGDITYVLDGTTGEVIRELTGNIVRFFEDSGVFVVSKDDDEKRSGTSYGLMDIDMNVLTEGWDGYSNLYKGGTDDYFTFYNYVDNTYVTDTYIVSKEGEVVFGPFAEKDTWIFIMNDDKFITERYDTVNYNPIYEMYDYEGNSLEFDKDYVSIQRQYNFNGVKDYIIAAYDNPVSAGYLYDVLDMDLNVLYSGFNYIYPYGNGGRVASVSKGFDIGLFDLETGEWVYSERSFNSLDD